mgnify:CR=1 FL=1
MAFQNHEGQVRSFQMPAYFWVRRAERSREEGQPVRALRWMSWLRHSRRSKPSPSVPCGTATSPERARFER